MSDINQLNRIKDWNQHINKMSAIKRIEWALLNLPSQAILSSSFGIQSVVMLHMLSTIDNKIPVILADTGHLFPETYQYIETLTDKLQLNLHVYKPQLSAKEQQIKYGKLWEQGKAGIDKHYYLNKVEPFERAMADLNAQTWLSGVRAEQSNYRDNLEIITLLRNHIKVHPILDWSNADIEAYIATNKLPIHPLKLKGYQSVGDIHNTPLNTRQNVNAITRFEGEKRECGLHTCT